ncbi:hypothetical protein AB0L65_50190 [Nonomuraea sp. NPDC052116]|uniref:hypothetical protein n=1 Tax=Nonomuraea sp. NPDC052116 TaxID=3155665 RepID=UPI00342E5857
MEVSAAVVHSFDRPPRYEPFDLPVPADEDEVVLDVLAVGLHPRVRSGAAGRHCTSTGKLPMVEPAASVIPALLWARGPASGPCWSRRRCEPCPR